MESIPDIFEPGTHQRYTLEAFVRVTGLPRRSVLIYCRAGLLRPMGDQNEDVLEFDDECVLLARKIEELREQHGISLTGVRIIFDLLQEVERLQREVRFLRGH